MDIVLKIKRSEMYIRSTETLGPAFFLHLATKMVAARDTLSRWETGGASLGNLTNPREKKKQKNSLGH